MTHRQETPDTATSRPQSALHGHGDTQGSRSPERPSVGHAEAHAAAIRDVMLLGLPDARLHGRAGIRRIHEWADWLAEQAAHITETETRRLRAERDLLARTLAIHTHQTVDTVLADTRAALRHS